MVDLEVRLQIVVQLLESRLQPQPLRREQDLVIVIVIIIVAT